MDDTYVYTAVSSAACGVYLQVGEIYLIMGKWPPHPHIINYYYVSSEICSIMLLLFISVYQYHVPPRHKLIAFLI